MNDDKPIKKLTNDERYAAVMGAVACTSILEGLPHEIRTMISHKAIALLEKSWDAIPLEQWSNTQELLKHFHTIQGNEREKRKEYYNKHSH